MRELREKGFASAIWVLEVVEGLENGEEHEL